MKFAAVVACALVSSGCDRVWGLTGDPAPPNDGRTGDGGDDGGSDGAIDAVIATNNDEDGDGLLDAVDACPGRPGNGVEPDADADGVGDACDPSGVNCHRRVAFYSFNEAPEMLSTQGAWSYGVDELGRGELVHTDPASDGFASYPLPNEHYYARMEVEVVDPGPNSHVMLGVGTIIGMPVSGFWCDLVLIDGALVGIRDVANTLARDYQSVAQPGVATFSIEKGLGTFRCRVDVEKSYQSDAIGLGLEEPLHVMIKTIGTGVRIRWLDVIDASDCDL